jgi:type IV secretion system protein VirD4
MATVVIGAQPGRGEPVNVTLDRHLLTIAATRWGKGMLLATNLLGGYRGSAFVFDPKGEMAWLTSHWRQKELGHKVVVLDPFEQVERRFHAPLASVSPRLAERWGSVDRSSWNPLRGLDPKAIDYTARLNDIAEGLVRSSARERHWDESAKMLLRGLCAAAVELHEENASLRDVWAWLKKPAELWRNELLGSLDEKSGLRGENGLLDRSREAYLTLTRFGGATNEVASIISNALTQTSFLDDGRMREVFEDPGPSRRFTFADLARRPMTVYLVLPPHLFNEHYGRWLRMLLQRAINEVMEASAGEKVLFMLDEFGTVGELSSVSTAFGLAGYALSLWPMVQDINQLQRDYRATWQTFIANCGAESYFGINDMNTAEHISRAWGDQQRRRPTLSTGGGVSQTPQWERETRPEEVVRLTQQRGPEGEVTVLLRRGGVFEKIENAPYYAFPRFVARARPDPYQAASLAFHEAQLAASQ